MSEAKDEATEGSPEQPVEVGDAGFDFSWMAESESDYFLAVEPVLTKLGMEVVQVSRVDVALKQGERHLCPISFEAEADVQVRGQKVLKKRVRLRVVREDEVWACGQAGHVACKGLGYIVLPKEAPPEAPSVEVTKEDGSVSVEVRYHCSCAVEVFFMKNRRKVVADRKSRFVYWLVEGVAEEAESIPEPSVREQYLLRAGKFKKEAEGLRAKLSEIDAEIEEASKDMKDDIACLTRERTELEAARDRLPSEVEPFSSAVAEAQSRVRRAQADVEDAEANLADAKAALRTHEQALHSAEARSAESLSSLSREIAERARKIDTYPVPSRVSRLQRDRRYTEARIEKLLKKAEQKQSFAGVGPLDHA